MGQKIHPYLLRFKNTTPWHAEWFESKNNFAKTLILTRRIRSYLWKKYRHAELDKINIGKNGQKFIITLHSGKPGIIIGRSGQNIEVIVADLKKKFNISAEVHVQEVRRPELSAAIGARNVCEMLEKRITFRRAGKGMVEKIMQKGAKGVKIRIAGRLGGADIARSEVFHDGDIPLSTIRADIDYAHDEAATTYGVLGIKVWIHRSK
jgi:small subunit ribosomal protein S3